MASWLHRAFLVKGVAFLIALVVGVSGVIFIGEAVAKHPQIKEDLSGNNNRQVNFAAWSHNNKKIALLDEYGGLRVFDTSTGRSLLGYGSTGFGVRKDLRWNDDDTKLYVSPYLGNLVNVYDATTGEFLSRDDTQPSERQASGKIECEGDDFSVIRPINSNGTVAFDDGEVWQGTRKLYLLKDVWRCAFVPHTQHLSIISYKGSALVIDRSRPSTTRALPFSDLTYLAASNDGKRLAFGRNNLIVFDLETWQAISKSAFYGSEWITVSAASNHYVSSEDGDLGSTVTFKTFIGTEYPLRFYRSDLRKEILEKAWAGPSTAVHPKFFSLARTKISETPPTQIADAIGTALSTSIHSLLTQYSELNPAQKGLVWPTILTLVLSVLLSALWIFSPSILTEYALASEISVDFPIWKRLQNWLLLAAWLGHQKRPLDAWLRRNKDFLFQQCFADRNSVKNRSTYVDLGNEADTAHWDKAVLHEKQSFIQIIGPGGCGKTSLAVEWSRRTTSLGLSSPIVPIIVDEDWQGSLLDYFARSLSIREKRPTPQMVRKLGKLGRISILIDGLSERRAQNGAINQVIELALNERFKYVLITSRTIVSDNLGKVIMVAPLSGDILYNFVSSYVSSEDQKKSVLTMIATFSRGRPVRPLLAKLAIEQFAAQSTKAKTVAELVQNYILALRQPTGLREGDILRAARLAARACVWEHLIPLEISTEYLHGQIAAEAARLPFVDEAGISLSTSEVFDQLVTSGLMQKSFLLATMRVKFALDPIAEYLVAMDAIAAGGNTLAVLQDRIAAIGEPALGLQEVISQLERETESSWATPK